MRLRLEDVLRLGDTSDFRLATLDALSVSGLGERQPTPPPIPREKAEEWLAFAERNRVAPIVAHRLLELFGEEGPWHAVHMRSQKRMDVLLGELDSVADRLAAESIHLVALKNAGIARGIFPCAACCPMGDLDVLVERRRFRDAHALVLESGFELATRSTVEEADLEAGLSQGGLEYVKQVSQTEVWLELQWRSVAGRWIRRDQEPDTERLIAQSVPIEGSSARLLAPADNLLQVALHTAKHSFIRAPGLRLHTDVDRLVAFTPPEWSDVVSAAQRHQVCTPVFFSLALANALLDTPIPSRVLSSLAPPRWKSIAISRWIRHRDVFEPNERKFSRPEMLAFHALLYDDLVGLVASTLDAEPSELKLRRLPRHIRKGIRRILDLTLRYQA